MIKRLITFILSAVLITGVCEAKEPAFYRLNVQDFSELKVTDNLSVIYESRADSAGWVSFICEPEIASCLMFNNNKNCLTIQLSTEEPTLPGSPVVHVYSAALRKVENSGDSTLVLRHIASVPSLKIRVIGNGRVDAQDIKVSNLDAGITTGCGTIDVSGKAKKSKLHNVGTGPIHAFGLDSESVKCMILGTGPIECMPGKELSIYGAGSGKVHYRGTPKVTNRSIGVKLINE